MKKLLQTILLTFSLLFPLTIRGQYQAIDSLRQQLQDLPEDAIIQRAALSTELSEYYWDLSLDTAEYYANQSLQLAKKVTTQSREIKHQEAIAFNSLGIIYYTRVEYAKALVYFNQGLNIHQELGNKRMLGVIHSNIGLIYDTKKEYPRAIKEYELALNLYKEADSAASVANIISIYGNIGTCYRASGELSRALENVQKAIHLSEQVNYPLQIGNNKMEAGCILTNMGKFKEAEVLLLEALEVLKPLEYNYFLSYCYECLGTLADSTNQPSVAVEYAQQAHFYALDAEAQDILMSTTKLLAKNYAKLGKYKEAFEALQEANEYQSSLFNEDKERELHRIELERKDYLISSERQEKELQKAVNTKQNLIILSISVALFSSMFIGFLLFRSKQREHKNNIQLEKQQKEIMTQNSELHQQREEISSQRDFIEQANLELKEQHSKIKDSISAAQLIQEAILPAPEELSNYFRDYFLIYEPKDVVSGDFYWVKQVKDSIIVATVDCTGHGVPGAFMSMIGNMLLDEIITLAQNTDPALILTELNKQIIRVLKQKSSHDLNGMDIAVLKIPVDPEPSHTTITFAAAKRSLYYYSASKHQIEILKGTNKSIGGRQNDKDFINHTLTLKSGSMLYVGSDGYEDQHNTRNRKIGRKDFTKVLLEEAKYMGIQQKRALIEHLRQHMKGVHQRDDILVLGIRV